MRILLAPDSFKEAASAEAIAQAMARGIKRGNPQAECWLMPLSDGGEGLTHALVHATGGTLHDVETVDAVGRPITAQYGFLGNNHASCTLRTAVVELASASGLEQVSPADRDPMAASTFGTGLLRSTPARIALCSAWEVAPPRMAVPDWLTHLDFVFSMRMIATFRLVAALLLIWQGLTIQEFPIPSKTFRLFSLATSPIL